VAVSSCKSAWPKGKKQHDKRQASKEHDTDREIRRVMRNKV
jgi:SsrA-binding protein